MTDILRARGDTYANIVVVTDAVGAAVDITGYSFLMTIDPSKAPVDNTNNLFQLTGIITDAPNGRVEFEPTAIQTDLVGSYFYDIQMTDDAGRIRTIATGKYKFVQDITKD